MEWFADLIRNLLERAFRDTEKHSQYKESIVFIAFLALLAFVFWLYAKHYGFILEKNFLLQHYTLIIVLGLFILVTKFFFTMNRHISFIKDKSDEISRKLPPELTTWEAASNDLLVRINSTNERIQIYVLAVAPSRWLSSQDADFAQKIIAAINKGKIDLIFVLPKRTKEIINILSLIHGNAVQEEIRIFEKNKSEIDQKIIEKITFIFHDFIPYRKCTFVKQSEKYIQILETEIYYKNKTNTQVRKVSPESEHGQLLIQELKRILDDSNQNKQSS
ncbi:MAG: hypothetical protein QXS54_07990 [Candidatus Methanomethylicaceae archaeon]